MEAKKYVKELIKSHNNISTQSPKSQLSVDIKGLFDGIFAPGPYYFFVNNLSNMELVYVSENISEFHNVSPMNLHMKDLVDLIHPDDKNFLLQSEAVKNQFFNQYLGQEEVFDYAYSETLRFKDRSGQYRLFLRQGVILSVGFDGRFEHVLHIHIDISHIAEQSTHVVSFLSRKQGESFIKVPVQGPFSLEGTNLFTPREMQILRLLADGKSAGEIAQILSISFNTVRTIRLKMLRRSNCENTTSMVAKCIREGIIH